MPLTTIPFMTIAGYKAASPAPTESIIYITDSGKEGMFKLLTGSLPADDTGINIQNTAGTTCYQRIFDSAANVKWFGAGIAVDFATSTDSDAIKKAVDFIASNPAKNYNLYFPKGEYYLKPNTSPATDAIYIDLQFQERIVVFGDGAGESILRFQGVAGLNLMTIVGIFNNKIEVRDLSFVGGPKVNDSQVFTPGTGLKLQKVNFSNATNLEITLFEKGLDLVEVNECYFNSILCNYNKVGIEGQNSGPTGPTGPNLLNFTSCTINSNTVTAVKLGSNANTGLHSVLFNSCGFASNGYIYGTGINTNAESAIQCFFDGIQGANGLNVTNCYFEDNYKFADIQLTVKSGSKPGTHTFIGNTFNRNSEIGQVANNIKVIGGGQSNPEFSASKCKLVFLGNGFLSVQPSDPPLLGKAIDILYSGIDYGEFDIVDEGNSYSNWVYIPIFNNNTPQISANTRVLASGRVVPSPIVGNTITNPSHCYNIASVKTLAIGSYRITFALPMITGNKAPATFITPVSNPLFGFVYFETQTYIDIKLTNSSGTGVNSDFNILII